MPHKDPRKSKDYAREWHQKKRLECIRFLGGQCVSCGVNDPIVLDVDHINNDGAIERRKMTSNQIFVRILDGRLFRARYQLLCKNCNWRKEYFRRNLT